MSRIFFTSDTHYFHKNIAGPKVSKWKSGYRDFEDEKEMSRHIVKVFNQTVAEDDILYHLGDWSFGGIQNIWNFRKQLRCQNIHLICGNHDEHIKANKLLPNDDLPEGVLTAKHPDIFTSVTDTWTIKYGKHTFFMSHYSHQVWLGSHKGYIHLFGHSHDSIKGIGKSMDVGIDVAKRLLGEYRPFSIEEVIDIMDRKDVAFLDGHNENTNVR